MKQIARIVLCSAVMMTTSTAVTADEYKDEIKARQGYYQLVKYNFGVLGAMVKGKKDYDAETAQLAAQNLSKLSKVDNSLLWPQGSDSTALDTTKAKIEIWQNFADIQKKQGTWQAAIEKLTANAGNGLAALKEDFAPVGKACKACHDDYKAK